MKRYRQLSRCLCLADVLRDASTGGPPVTISALADRFQVSTRTIRRDLVALKACGRVWSERAIASEVEA